MKALSKNDKSVKPLKIKDFSKRADWDKPLNLDQIIAAERNKFTKRKQAKKKVA
jgi:hypothetical protein